MRSSTITLQGVLLEMTHKHTYLLVKGVCRSSPHKQESTSKAKSPVKKKTGAATVQTLKTSRTFMEQCIYITVTMDLSRILARYTLYPRLKDIVDIQHIQCGGWVEILHCVRDKTAPNDDVNEYLVRISKAISLDPSDVTSIRGATKTRDKRSGEEIRISLFTIAYSNALALMNDALKECPRKAKLLEGGYFIGTASTNTRTPINGMIFQPPSSDLSSELDELIDSEGCMTTFGALNTTMTAIADDKLFVLNPQVLFNVIFEHNDEQDETTNGNKISHAVQQLAEVKYDLGLFNEEKEQGTGKKRKSSGIKKTKHEKAIDAIEMMSTGETVLHFLYKKLEEKTKNTQDKTDELLRAVTRAAEIYQGQEKEEAEHYLKGEFVAEEEGVTNATPKSRRKKKARDNSGTSRKSISRRVDLVDTSSESSDTDNVDVKENNMSPIELVRADIGTMSQQDEVKMSCEKVGEEDTIFITMNNVSFYYNMNARKARRFHNTSHAKIWTNLHTDGKWYKAGWRKDSTEGKEKITIKRKNGTVASSSSSVGSAHKSDGELLN